MIVRSDYRKQSIEWPTYSLSSESDTLLGVQDGTFPDKGLDATGTTVDLVKSDLSENLASVFSTKFNRKPEFAGKIRFRGIKE